MSYLRKRKEIDESLIDVLESATGCRREVCVAMLMRDIDDVAKAKAFLHPYINNLTPLDRYDGMDAARNRIQQAIDGGEKIVIYGDYDCDGVCATSMLYLFLKTSGVEVDYYIPVRKKEGYGINRAALEEIAENLYPDLIVTVDCGISSRDDIEYGMEELGIDFIVTDHHEPPQELPNCIIVDPKINRSADCFNELCGAGIVLRLIESFGGVNAMMLFIDLACLATIADIVPLVSDNRIIVNYGIDIINARARQSVKLLLDMTYPNEPNKVVKSHDIAYKIVPKINAVGRLADSRKSVEMFTEDDYFYAKNLVERAIEYNEERQRLTNEVYNDALYKLEEYDLNQRVIVLNSPSWEIGVLGIACAKLVTDFNRPVILLTQTQEGICKGSCRSIAGVNLHEALSACSMYLDSFGGHAMACGLTAKADNLPLFAAALHEYLSVYGDEPYLPKYIYDMEVTAEEFNVKLMEDMSVLAPFGEGNPPINYLIKADEVLRIGKTDHARIILNSEGELVNYSAYNNLKAIADVENKKFVTTGENAVFANRLYASGVVSNCVYDASSYMGNNDYAAIRHAYQLSFAPQSLFATRSINDEKIEEILSKGIYGTCFLCYNIDTYRQFITKFGNKTICKDIVYFSGLNPYNRIVIDVSIKEPLTYYDNVVFLDKPFSLGIIDFLRLKRDCIIYLHDSADVGYSANSARLAGHIPDLERMRELFTLISAKADSKEYRTFAEMYDTMVNECSVIEFYTAAYTFFELKLLGFRGGVIKRLPNVKTKLENSVLYKNLLLL